MHTITVDDESLSVRAMQRTLSKADPEGVHSGVYKVSEFFDYVRKHDDIDIAFVDIEMNTDGITVTKKLKEIVPDINIVIYSGHPQYKADALDQHVSSFIVKPVTDEKLAVALANLRHPLKEKRADRKLKVVTFGNFIVYTEPDQVMTFSISHSMDVFAYLIDKCGYAVTARDIAADVFERDEFTKQTSKDISKYVNSLIKDLTAAGFGDVVIKQNRLIKINKNRISCDLYDALSGDRKALETFKGEYMIDYSRAEESDNAEELKSLAGGVLSDR